MHIEQLNITSLGEFSYFIEDSGEAAIIDPFREVGDYIALAKKHSATIKFIFETHIHSDFVSGHFDLERLTGARIIYGPGAGAWFPFYSASDNETFMIGNVSITAVHTPGHTLESTCYLLTDEHKKPVYLFTGDTLLIGNAGRPELISGIDTPESLSSNLFDSIAKLSNLSGNPIIYPGHGQGSTYGKDMSMKKSSTLDEQKKENPLFSIVSREEFIKTILSTLPQVPVYFPVIARINRDGYQSLDSVKAKALTGLSLDDFQRKIAENIIILDTRKGADFKQGFIPGALFIGLEGRFAQWAGSLLPFHQRMILLVEKGKEEETVTRLAGVGFDNVEGYLTGGFDTWKKSGNAIDMIIDVDPDELAMDIPFDPQLLVIDVRTSAEFGESHVSGSMNMSLAEMTDLAMIAQLEETQNIYVHCSIGYRSVIACSILKKEGYHNIRNVNGTFEDIKGQPGIIIEKETSVLN
ncbi:MAG: MBL fold metallo-hydrolase [Ginsengibacter sp.]